MQCKYGLNSQRPPEIAKIIKYPSEIFELSNTLLKLSDVCQIAPTNMTPFGDDVYVYVAPTNMTPRHMGVIDHDTRHRTWVID
jgi:hypothetical protein